jgi:tetratricopeptide (TPR) repeat protein
VNLDSREISAEHLQPVPGQLDRAIELDAEYAWAIARRGETYREMERYDDALADFNRAIELDPGDDDYAATRDEICQLMSKDEDT